MFGRRNRRLLAAQEAARAADLARTEALAAASRPPRVDLDEAELFEVVLERLQEFVGEHGSWTLARRSDLDTEEIFHDMAALTLARAVTSSVVDSAARNGAAVARSLPQRSTDAASDPTATDRVTASTDVVEPGAVSADSTKSDVSASDAHTVRTVMELDAVAIWADPKTHDPAYVDERLLAPARDAAAGERREAESETRTA